jgi:hypothetical protein
MLPTLQLFNYGAGLLIPALGCLGSQLIKILIILLLISSPLFCFHDFTHSSRPQIKSQFLLQISSKVLW